MGATAVISPLKLLRPIHPLVWVMISMLAVWGAGAVLTDQNSASFGSSGTGPPGVSERIVVRDLANGAVGIFHAESGAAIVRYESGQGAFVRTIFRSLVRDRRVQGVSAGPVFILYTLGAGDIIVEDPSTNSRIQLKAFGEPNAQHFRQMLDSAINLSSIPHDPTWEK
jgi:putative photosynthetic complex assembly protein